MIDTDKYEKYKPTQANYQTSERYIKELLTEVMWLRGILGDIIAIDEWGGDGKDVGITITWYGDYTFSGWLNKVYDGVTE